MNRHRDDRVPVRTIRLGLAVVTAFVALTAIGGGLALLTGLEGERYPLENLAGTSFDTYTIPALLLAGVVGGSSAISFVSCLRPRAPTGSWVVAAGAILMGWVVGEVAILHPPHWSWIETLYFALGAVLLAGGSALPHRSSGQRNGHIRPS